MELNKVWPEWQVVDKLGEGSYGKVYRCTSEKNGIKRESAIKVISVPQSETEHESLRREGMTEDTIKNYFYDMVQNFTNEIHVMEVLQGTKNIVSVEDYKVVERKDEIGWDIYIRMELLKGFRQYSEEHKMSEADVAKLGKDICIALEECEKRKILHRDIKPENIFIDGDGNFKIGDFGVARQLENTSTTMSQKGTYNYMAPEVVSKKKGDCRADIYSLGMVMYKLLNNNREPFVDPDKQMIRYRERVDAVEKRLNGEKLPAPKNASEEMANVILKACEFDKENRYASAAEFRKAIETVVPSESVSIKSRTKSVSSKVRLFVRMNKSKLAISALSLLLVACIVGGSVAVVKYRREQVARETEMSVPNNSSNNFCGPNITYSFNEQTGELTLSGTGRTFDYYNPDNDFDYDEPINTIKSPWNGVFVKSVIIGEGITRLGDGLFEKCFHINTVEFPKTLKEIGINTFHKCEELKYISLPDSVEIIDNNAFEECTELQTVNMSQNIKRVGTDAFKNTAIEQRSKSLDSFCIDSVFLKNNSCETKIKINSGITVVADNAFYNHELAGITNDSYPQEVILPNSLISIGSGAFWGCSALEKINFGKSLKIIYDDAFTYSGLKEIVLPDSIEEIGYRAFEGCDKLTKVTLPSKAIKLGGYIFEDTPIQNRSDNWENGCFYIGKHLLNIEFSRSSVDVKPGTISVAEGSSYYADRKIAVNIPESVEYIGYLGISSTYNSDENKGIVAINVSPNNRFYTSVSGVLFDKGMKTLLRYPECKTESAYKVPDGVTQIADYAFSASQIKSVELPNSLTKIGEGGFIYSKISSIAIPDNVTDVGDYAFQGTMIEDVKLSKNLHYISKYMFDETNLKNFVIPEHIKTICECSFGINLKSVTVPQNTYFISDNVFDKGTLIICYKDSPAYEFAQRNSLSIKLIISEEENETTA